MSEYPRKINDDRLVGYVKRTRDGRVQVFYHGNDSRDFARYKDEGGGRVPDVEMHDKPDTIRITPPEKHIYAELIDGEWWWVNGCAECNGKPRDWLTYIECEKHNVCAKCAKPSKDVKERWGRKTGWVCDVCKDIEHEEEKAKALAAMPDEYCEYDYADLTEVRCPYCNYEFDYGSYWEADEEEVECPCCDNTFIVTAEPTVFFTMRRKEDE